MVGAGVTLHEALTAYETLKGEGTNIRVVDPFTLKPIDKTLLIESAKATGGLVVTVEDHYDQGKRYLYQNVACCVKVSSLAVLVYLLSYTCRWTW